MFFMRIFVMFISVLNCAPASRWGRPTWGRPSWCRGWTACLRSWHSHCIKVREGAIYIQYIQGVPYLLIHLGWVDFHFGCSTVRTILLGQMRIGHNMVSHISQPNPGARADGTPCKSFCIQPEGPSTISLLSLPEDSLPWYLCVRSSPSSFRQIP